MCGGGGQGGCERRIGSFCENLKKKIGGGGAGWWGQGGCERNVGGRG